MLNKILAALVFTVAATPTSAQEPLFRLVELQWDQVVAIDQNSLRTDAQGFRTFTLAGLMMEPDLIEVGGNEVLSRGAVVSAVMDCSSGQIRVDSGGLLDYNFAVVSTESPDEGFIDAEMPNLVRTVCTASAAEIAALSPAYPNLRSISAVAGDYAGPSARSSPRMLWRTFPHQRDRSSCLAGAYAAFQQLGYIAESPGSDWVGIHGTHPTLPIGALIRCDSPGEYVVFVSQPAYSLGNINQEIGRIAAVLPRIEP